MKWLPSIQYYLRIYQTETVFSLLPPALSYNQTIQRLLPDAPVLKLPKMIGDGLSRRAVFALS